VSLFAAVAAQAAPTIGDADALYSASASGASIVPVTGTVTVPGDLAIVDFAVRLPSPHELFSPPLAASYPQASPLPSVPRTLFMVLAGFLCVSLVRDRRFWLAVLAGIIWAGQAGVLAVPQLALRVANKSRTEQQLNTALISPSGLDHSFGDHILTAATQYVGLLRHLAGIPDCLCSSPKNPCFSLSEDKVGHADAALAFVMLCSLQANPCLITRIAVDRLVSSVFVFENLTRGPPRKTLNLFAFV
jgi:hypothetical protein